ncbi:MAG: UvrB/UvrC motif-containing protein, partial [Eubacteriales bacterium]|nr:UvrB/UvrC motif-containing protein [Eubacteriales bacterium]
MEQCEHCGVNPAEVHFTKIINGEKTELHLCRHCAEHANGAFFGEFPLGNVLIALLDAQPSQQDEDVPALDNCPNCGFEFARFVREGMLGCEKCYEHFAAVVNPAIKRMQGSLQHTGRHPAPGAGETAGQPAQPVQQPALAQLKEQLQLAITREEYEQAAVLRDRIKLLETKGE